MSKVAVKDIEYERAERKKVEIMSINRIIFSLLFSLFVIASTETFIVNNIDELDHVWSQSNEDEPIILALVYKTNCQPSMDLLRTLESSIKLLAKQNNENPQLRLPMFVQIPVSTSDSSQLLLERLSVSYVPTLIFLRKSTSSIQTIEYKGLKKSPEDLFSGLTFYISRLQHSTSQNIQHHPERDYLNALTVEMNSIEEMQKVLGQYQNQMLQHVRTPLDPLSTEEEQQWIRYILDEDSDEDPLRVICQCRKNQERYDDTLPFAYSDFSQVASILSLRRDVVFCIVKECTIDALVSSYNVMERNWSLEQDASYDPSATNKDNLYSSISEFCQQILRPSVLWMDRQMSAPILFSNFYRFHAVLFVDFHDIKQQDVMHSAVKAFRHECRRYQRNPPVVCSIVPSTDTRILTTLGVDMWTRVDKEVVEASSWEHSVSTIFPGLMITEKSEGTGIRRSFFESSFTSYAIQEFFQTVLSKEGKTQLKSSAAVPQNVKNSHGVHLLTGETIESFVEKEGKQTLVLFYSPTCGHCKRLNIAWNALGDLIEFLGWGDKLELGRLDVSSNEFFIKGAAVYWLPDILYFGDRIKTPIRYNTGEVGGISDPLDIIGWWLDVADDTIDQATLLRELKERDF